MSRALVKKLLSTARQSPRRFRLHYLKDLKHILSGIMKKLLDESSYLMENYVIDPKINFPVLQLREPEPSCLWSGTRQNIPDYATSQGLITFPLSLSWRNITTFGIFFLLSRCVGVCFKLNHFLRERLNYIRLVCDIHCDGKKKVIQFIRVLQSCDQSC